MAATSFGTHSAALSLAVLLSSASACSQSADQAGDKAVPEGVSSVDLVGSGKSLTPDGQNDALISLRLAPGGTVRTLTVHNVDGQLAVWDTSSTSASWILGVLDKQEPKVLLNRPDGSIEIKADKPKELLLYFADNGTVREGKTRLSVTVDYTDGTKKELPVERK